MESVAGFIAAYAALLLAGVVVGGLLGLLLVWTLASRYASALKARYSRTAQRLGQSRWVALLDRKFPSLRRVSSRPGGLVLVPLVSFVAILLSVYAFAELADGIGPNDDLNLFDRALDRALRDDPSAFAKSFLAWATHLGGGPILTALGFAVGITLLARRELALLYGWILAVGGTGLLNRLLKALFERARPGEIPLLESWSFPSGHAMNSMVAYGMLAYVLLRFAHVKWARTIIGVAITIVLVVGASRVLLHFHYLSDVLGGFAAGLAWLTVCITVTELALRRKRAT